ncbi:Protein of unknown function [Natronincola peptidivorans]|uniref:DUF3866 domain-containing protein n=1 Tax=Natronincola peptidivorans TaxID=426128 RepID=A0A1H9YN07_9FIRM|nr:DUF3866 family protein [Natronincola peptidivorans]SES70439.1 Protein of unknown function [Natronincola peptidivorans]
MISMKKGRVIKILEKLKKKTKLIVSIDGEEALAINYSDLTGEAKINDMVIINTTAVELKLGTGGCHFVISNFNNTHQELQGKGHIMKLRYTPLQLKVLAAEEQQSPYHYLFNEFTSLNGLPVIAGILHSMLTPIVSTLKYINSNIKIAYIMTDGAALPLSFSDTVDYLRNNDLIDTTITTGHAFGGDIETINIYNGLVAAKEIAKCDIAVVTMGPGIVGTGTPYGFSGIEQGLVLNAVTDLGGFSIGVPRISFSDNRVRHYGMSHHSLTIFSKICKTKCNIILPLLPKKEKKIIYNQIEDLNIIEKHNIIEIDGSILLDALKHFNLNVKTMGRDYDADPFYFLACSAAAMYGFNYLIASPK